MSSHNRGWFFLTAKTQSASCFTTWRATFFTAAHGVDGHRAACRRSAGRYRRDLPLRGFPDPFCPFDEDALKSPRVDEGKDAPEGAVGRYSIGEFEKGLEPVDFGVAESFDIVPVVGALDDGADCARDDVSEFGAF